MCPGLQYGTWASEVYAAAASVVSYDDQPDVAQAQVNGLYAFTFTRALCRIAVDMDTKALRLKATGAFWSLVAKLTFPSESPPLFKLNDLTHHTACSGLWRDSTLFLWTRLDHSYRQNTETAGGNADLHTYLHSHPRSRVGSLLVSAQRRCYDWGKQKSVKLTVLLTKKLEPNLRRPIGCVSMCQPLKRWSRQVASKQSCAVKMAEDRVQLNACHFKFSRSYLHMQHVIMALQ